MLCYNEYMKKSKRPRNGPLFSYAIAEQTSDFDLAKERVSADLQSDMLQGIGKMIKIGGVLYERSL